GPQRGSNTIQSARNAGGFGRGAWLRGRKAARKLDSQSPSQTRLIQASFSQRPSAARGRPTRRGEGRGLGGFLARGRSEFRPRHDDNIPGPAAPKRGRWDEAAFQIPVRVGEARGFLLSLFTSPPQTLTRISSPLAEMASRCGGAGPAYPLARSQLRAS